MTNFTPARCSSLPKVIHIMRSYLPTLTNNGLAMYRIGEGEPILFMPGPHRFQSPGDGSARPIIDGLLSAGRQVISFDPPGSGASTRRMRLSMQEMFDSADETLDSLAIRAPIDTIGHSMGGLCALAYALERPTSIRRLVLIGTGTGKHAYMDMPGALASPSHRGFWGMIPRAILHMVLPCRATETLLNNYIERQSYVDARFVHPETIRARDWLRSRRGRADWHRVASTLNYAPRLREIAAPTLVMCGRWDSQFPAGASEELAAGIHSAVLVMFEHSNHFPFIEEAIPFWEAFNTFMTEERQHGRPPLAELL